MSARATWWRRVELFFLGSARATNGEGMQKEALMRKTGIAASPQVDFGNLGGAERHLGASLERLASYSS